VDNMGVITKMNYGKKRLKSRARAFFMININQQSIS